MEIKITCMILFLSSFMSLAVQGLAAVAPFFGSGSTASSADDIGIGSAFGVAAAASNKARG